jgi:hypothetical protein
MRKELTIEEIDSQQVDLLPTRETLSSGWGMAANVWATNSSLAFNAASYESYAESDAVQTITITQDS